MKDEAIEQLRRSLDLATETLKTIGEIRSVFQGMETPKIQQWRRALAKKYHPDVNAGKMFTASEVMAGLNPLLVGLSKWKLCGERFNGSCGWAICQSMKTKQISKLRRELRLTQGQLAEHIGTSRETVNRWETGKHPPEGAGLRALEN